MRCSTRPRPEPNQDQEIPDDSFDSIIRGSKLNDTSTPKSVSSVELSQPLFGGKDEESWERIMENLGFIDDDEKPKETTELNPDQGVVDMVDTNTTPPPPPPPTASPTNTSPTTTNRETPEDVDGMKTDICRKRKRMDSPSGEGGDEREGQDRMIGKRQRRHELRRRPERRDEMYSK